MDVPDDIYDSDVDDVNSDIDDVNSDIDDDEQQADEPVPQPRDTKRKTKPPSGDKYKKYPESYNIVIPASMDALKGESPYVGSKFLTQTANTMMLLAGFVENIQFHEKDLINRAITNKDMLHYSSNFGTATHDGYLKPERPPKTNRGRKARQQKRSRERRKVGNGEDMNTQVCFWIRRPSARVIEDDIVPEDAAIFKIKLFRTGDLQLTGANQHTIGEGFECCQTLITTLNQIFHDGKPIAKLTHLVPSLKNYTLRIKRPNADSIVHLPNLRELLMIKKVYDQTNLLKVGDTIGLGVHPRYAPAHPRILSVSYTMQDSRVMINFATPLPWNPSKDMVMRIFVVGSVIIVGGLELNYMHQACEFLSWLLATNYPKLIVRIGECAYEDNIHPSFTDGFVKEELDKKRIPTRRADVEHMFPDSPQWLIDDIMPLWDWQKKYFTDDELNN